MTRRSASGHPNMAREQRTSSAPTASVSSSSTGTQPADSRLTPANHPAETLLALASPAMRGDAGQVATLLLADRAMREVGLTPTEMIALCRRPGAMLTIHAAVEGFAEIAGRLLQGGAILPGRIQTLDVTHTRPGRPFPFNEEAECDWRVLTLILEKRWSDAGTAVADEADGEGAEQEREEAECFAHATRSGFPFFLFGESAMVTPLIRLASHRCLDGGALDSKILTSTIATVTGRSLERIERRLSRLAAHGVRLEHMPLGDLSLAVRPGLALHRIFGLLERLGRRATEAAMAASGSGDGASEDDDEDGDDVASNLARSARPARMAGKAMSRTDGGRKSGGGGRAEGLGTSRNASSSAERSRTNGKDAGSIVVEPERDKGGAGQRPILQVETMAGLGRARDWAVDLKADLDLWRAGELRWDEMSTRLLLHGPPGTGKTSFARALSNTLDLPLHVASVQVWLEPGYLGSVLKRMGAAFAHAADAAPAILFIDEADAIGRRQPDTKEYADYWNAIVNRMLELMDGAVRSEGVIVLGATNRPEVLDKALTRSGRWEQQIALPKPDRAALAAIIAHHLGADLERMSESAGDPVADATTNLHGAQDSLPLDRLSRRAVGRTGADIERLVREARGRARREKRAVAFADLQALLDAGRPQRSDVLRRRMALHEAGHAVVQHGLRSGTLVSLSIEDDEGGSAISRLDHSVAQDETWMTAQLAALLGGRAAEVLVLGDVSGGSGGDETSDLARATQIALAMETEFGFGAERPLTHRSTALAQSLLLRPGPLAEAVEHRLQSANRLAATTLAADRLRLLRLADALQTAGSLDATEIAAILDGGPDVGVTQDSSLAWSASSGRVEPD